MLETGEGMEDVLPPGEGGRSLPLKLPFHVSYEVKNASLSLNILRTP